MHNHYEFKEPNVSLVIRNEY